MLTCCRVDLREGHAHKVLHRGGLVAAAARGAARADALDALRWRVNINQLQKAPQWLTRVTGRVSLLELRTSTSPGAWLSTTTS